MESNLTMWLIGQGQSLIINLADVIDAGPQCCLPIARPRAIGLLVLKKEIFKVFLVLIFLTKGVVSSILNNYPCIHLNLPVSVKNSIILL